MQFGVFVIVVALYISHQVDAFEFDFVGKSSNNFADGTNDYVRSVGARRDLSMSGGSVSGVSAIERPSAPRRLIQPPPLKRSVNDEQINNVYRWLAYNVPVPDY
uniref:Uncharacterized protein n=1 Tax=Panagrolaimus sp. JU765 TaxID=591449 RepID=A0AC34R2W0_9BILA